MFILYISDISDMDDYFLFYFSFAKEIGRPDWEGYGSFIHWWTKRYGIVNKAICGSKEFYKFYKLLPHRTYCFDGDKPAGSAKCKDRLTLLIITNMDGSDHRKLSVIGKSKTPRCLQKKYKMQVKDMSVDWYASKNVWMTGEIHHQIMSKLNNEMRLSNRHICMFVTMLPATKSESIPTSSSSCYPPMPLQLCSH